tara:strand:+ start:493 stop:966 length:474 start_codon:yes stop_codon:yes gene_type:complete
MKKLYLTGKHNENGTIYAMVDDEDFERCSKYKWLAKASLNKNQIYGQTKVNKKFITLHRFICKCSIGDGIIIEHRDMNGLNNQKSNLNTNGTSLNNNQSRNRIFKKPVSNICNKPIRYQIQIKINGTLYTKSFSKKKYTNALELAQNHLQYLKDTHY